MKLALYSSPPTHRGNCDLATHESSGAVLLERTFDRSRPPSGADSFFVYAISTFSSPANVGYRSTSSTGASMMRPATLGSQGTFMSRGTRTEFS